MMVHGNGRALPITVSPGRKSVLSETDQRMIFGFMDDDVENGVISVLTGMATD